MSIKALTMGDMLVEIMRDKVGQDLKTPGVFKGPYPSGAPVIFAGALSKLGVNTAFIGSVGDDEFGEAILERLNNNGIATHKVQILKEYTTGTAFVTYFKDGSRKFIYHVNKAAAGQLSKKQLNEGYLKQFNHLHVMGTSLAINENWRHGTLQTARLIKDWGGTISFDPNLRPEMLEVKKLREACFKILEITDVFLPGEKELQEISTKGNIKKAARNLINKGIEVVAIKRGSSGSIIVTEKEIVNIASYEVELVDPTGAGDCYDAGFLKGYFEGWDWERVGKLANARGALAVTKKGPMEGVYDLRKVNEFIQRTDINKKEEFQ